MDKVMTLGYVKLFYAAVPKMNRSWLDYLTYGDCHNMDVLFSEGTLPNRQTLAEAVEGFRLLGWI